MLKIGVRRRSPRLPGRAFCHYAVLWRGEIELAGEFRRANEAIDALLQYLSVELGLPLVRPLGLVDEFSRPSLGFARSRQLWPAARPGRDVIFFTSSSTAFKISICCFKRASCASTSLCAAFA
jgi:hypothetical protein